MHHRRRMHYMKKNLLQLFRKFASTEEKICYKTFQNFLHNFFALAFPMPAEHVVPSKLYHVWRPLRHPPMPPLGATDAEEAMATCLASAGMYDAEAGGRPWRHIYLVSDGTEPRRWRGRE